MQTQTETIRLTGVLLAALTIVAVGFVGIGAAAEQPESQSSPGVECESVAFYSTDLCVGYRIHTPVETPVAETPGGSTEYTFEKGTPGEIVDFARVETDGEQTLWAKVRFYDQYSRVTTEWTEASYLKAGTCDTICLGDVVETTTALNVRDFPLVTDDGNNLLKTAEPGERAAVLSGPVKAQGYRWWKLTYEDGTTGWSVENWLVEVDKNADEFSTELPDVDYESDFQIEGEQLVACSVRICADEPVQTTAYLNVRTDHDLDADRVGTVDPGTNGTVLEESVYADGYEWFKVEYEDGTVGWSAANWFAEYTCVAYCVGDSVELYPEAAADTYLFEEPAPKDRPERSSDDPRIRRTVEPGTSATVIGKPRAVEDGIWWRVELSDGTTGWVPGYAFE